MSTHTYPSGDRLDAQASYWTKRDVTNRPVESSNSRFAVATFETWGSLQKALNELQGKGLTADTFSCLGLRHLFADKPTTLANQLRGDRELEFANNPETVFCTCGTLADCLLSRLTAGASTLGTALGHWLIPRHANDIQRAVLAGQIVFWVQLFDNADERRAYDALLANSSQSVGVHDLVND